MRRESPKSRSSQHRRRLYLMAKAKASTGIVGLEVVQNEGGADWAVQQDAEGDLEGGGL